MNRYDLNEMILIKFERDELRSTLKSTIEICNMWREKSEGQTKENEKQMSHTELQRRIIASKNEEIAKLRDLLEEWHKRYRHRVLEDDSLLERTGEALGK